MTRAIADHEELDRFASDLQHFCRQLEQNLNTLNGSFSRLGETWRDQEHARFAQDYAETTRVLQQFMRAADEHVPLLRRKAQRLRDFLSQR